MYRKYSSNSKTQIRVTNAVTNATILSVNSSESFSYMIRSKRLIRYASFRKRIMEEKPLKNYRRCKRLSIKGLNIQVTGRNKTIQSP